MTDQQNVFTPDWISPPGDTINDILDERGWSRAEFATRTGFTRKHVNQLVKGHVTLSTDSAERLALVLGSTVDFWLVREAQYRASLERHKAADNLRSDAGWLKELPVAWMVKQKWIERFSHRGEQVAECLRFFGVASVDAWRERYAEPLAAFRVSKKFAKQIGAVAAWLRAAEREATEIKCEAYDRAGFKSAAQSLRELTNESDPARFVPRLVDLCSAHGVAVVFIPHPPGCPASGATRWLTPEKAMLALSLRHKSNDHLWFAFFHEAAHLVLHGKKMLFIDGLEGLDDDKEEEANGFAREFLVPSSAAKELTQVRSRHEIEALARRLGVAPGIVVGRMQNEGLLPWSHHNSLKVFYAWE